MMILMMTRIRGQNANITLGRPEGMRRHRGQPRFWGQRGRLPPHEEPLSLTWGVGPPPLASRPVLAQGLIHRIAMESHAKTESRRFNRRPKVSFGLLQRGHEPVVQKGAVVMVIGEIIEAVRLLGCVLQSGVAARG